MNGFDKNIKFPSGNIICDGCLQEKTNNKSYKISETRAMPITLYYKHKYIVMIIHHLQIVHSFDQNLKH